MMFSSITSLVCFTRSNLMFNVNNLSFKRVCAVIEIDGVQHSFLVKTHDSQIVNKLPDNMIFVFGSNESGIHGAGAARTALAYFGAIWGKPFGFYGQSYAIPTKDTNIQTLDNDSIQEYISLFLQDINLKGVLTSEVESNLEYFITKIGSGLAGIPVGVIASIFFKEVVKNLQHLNLKTINLHNMIIPFEFVDSTAISYYEVV